MPFRRRRTASFRRRGTREQLLWFRQNVRVPSTAGFGVGSAVTIFDPDAFQAGNVDETWTVRRIHVAAYVVQTITVAGTAPGQIFTSGIELLGRQEAAANPNLVAATDQQADWLTIRSEFGLFAVGRIGSGSSGFDQDDTSVFTLDVRSQRKVNNDQVLIYVLNNKLADVAVDTPPTQTRFDVDVHSSVLFQRTRR